MLKSKIVTVNGRPMISINGKNYPPLAYTTYFDECGKWSDFIKSGYKMFFVNVSFTDLPINNMTGFTPFRTGVFETQEPDYSEFDEIVRGIVSECPDAFIFPRINISMPRWWTEENICETVVTEKGGRRESMYSDRFKSDGAKLLIKLVSHIRSSDYAGRIAGYQLCGGTTQEWMHHDLFGSFSDFGMEKFRQWAEEKYKISDIKIPLKEDFYDKDTAEIRKYYGFCNEKVAEAINYFAKTLKEITDYEQIAGVFYGYNAFVNDPLYGLHGLGSIIDSPYIDFFSSPCCYDGNRRLGIDWGDMLPVDSVKLHGKLCFIECDIRTHLTRGMQEARPGLYPDGIYTLYDKEGNKTVWCGPESPELSVSALRKAFLHQAVKGSGIWWFDMWGGWYHSDELMSAITEMRILSEKSKDTDSAPLLCAEAVLFIDERAYRNVTRDSHLRHSVNIIRAAMGNTGIPFDTYMVEDAPRVLHKYRAAVFTAPVPSESGEKALELCKSLDIPYILPNGDKYYYTTDELREFLVCSDIHCYNTDGAVIYCGSSILGAHTASDGEIKITLPKKYRLRPLFGDDKNVIETDILTLHMQSFATEAFEILSE